MNNFNVVHPWLLAFLWLVPLAALGLGWLRNRQRKRTAAWLSSATRNKGASPRSAWRFFFQLSLLAAGFLFSFLALSRPRWGDVQEVVTRQGRDLMIVLDVSRSMLAEDVMPNRLERAKADLMDLINTLDGDRAGLILFRHKAVQACPLTTDYAFLFQMLDAASPDSAAPGETDIGDAIVKALDALGQQAGGHQAIVLVSDGEDLAENIQDAAEKAKARGITIFTVGFGSQAGSAIPDPTGGAMTYQGKEVKSKLNAATLRGLASATEGVYVPVETARVNLGDLYRNHLRKLASRELGETVTRRQVERFSWFLLPAIMFWLAAGALSPGRPSFRSRRPNGGKAALAALLFMALSTASEAVEQTPPSDTRRLAQAAQSLGKAGRHEEAAAEYKKAALRASPREAARYYFNAGCALHAAGRYSEAADAFRASESARPLPDIPAAYNQGCALFQAADAADGWKTNATLAQARVERLAASAKAFQAASQKKPVSRDDPAIGNLALAADRTEEARRQARELKLEEMYGALDASQLAQQLLDRQRKLGFALKAALSYDTPSQIQQLETLAAEEREISDIMPPLTRKLETALQQSGGTNAARQAAELRQHTAALRDLLKRTADRLRDADADAREMVPVGERASYNLWKSVASYEPLLQEDIRVQSNSVFAADRFSESEPPTADSAAFIAEQEECAQLTRLFTERFTQAVPEEGLPGEPGPSSSSNAPALTAEARAKIVTLAAQTESMQNAAVQAVRDKNWTSTRNLTRDAYAKLKEIESMLPKQKQSQQNQSQQQEEPKQDPNKDPSKSDQNQQQENQKDQQKPEPDPESKDKPGQEEPQPAKEEMSEEQARQLLEKARMREKEYQDEKRKRDFSRAPLGRDW
ncbi:MAG: VWA domain-containing protein [Kiritimatiellia bacterium]